MKGRFDARELAMSHFSFPRTREHRTCFVENIFPVNLEHQNPTANAEYGMNFPSLPRTLRLLTPALASVRGKKFLCGKKEMANHVSRGIYADCESK
jgi:hypothetical protein